MTNGDSAGAFPCIWALGAQGKTQSICIPLFLSRRPTLCRYFVMETSRKRLYFSACSSQHGTCVGQTGGLFSMGRFVTSSFMLAFISFRSSVTRTVEAHMERDHDRFLSSSKSQPQRQVPQTFFLHGAKWLGICTCCLERHDGFVQYLISPPNLLQWFDVKSAENERYRFLLTCGCYLYIGN